MDDEHYIWVCPKCKTRQYTEMELCPKCCLRLKKQLYTPESPYPTKSDDDNIHPDREPDQNEPPSVDKAIKILLLIILVIIAYYLIFGCELRISFSG